MTKRSTAPTEPEEYPELRSLEKATDLLDSRFRIPGTNIRFGLDFLLGLIPGVGDAVALGLSGYLVVLMVDKGASGMVVAKMIGNIFLDAIVGSVPVIGDLFDIGYKANRRNLRLLKEHYEEGKHQGSARGVIMGVLAAILLLFVLTLFIIWQIFRLLFGLF